MDLGENGIHVFVTRIWLEERDEKGRAIWRGHITHVLTGKRRYVQSIEDIPAFIKPYIQAMAADGN